MSDPDYAAPYAELRQRVTELVRGNAAAAGTIAPAAPEWRVRDVLSHVVGICDDILNGNLDGVTTEPWTAAQVDKRRDRSVDEILDEWAETGPQIEEQMRAAPVPEFGQLLFDAMTHEHDIRGALDEPGARDSSAVVVGFEWLVGRGFAGPATCTFVTDHGTTTVGEGDVFLEVHAPRFEIVRGFTGRRRLQRLLAWEWVGTPHPEVFGAPPIFRRTEVDLVE